MDDSNTSQTPRHPNAFLALLLQVWVFLKTCALTVRAGYHQHMQRFGHATGGKRFARDEAAVMGLPNFVAITMTIVGGVLAAVVGMIVLNQMANPFFDNFTEFLTTLGGISTGNGIADAIISIMIIVFAIVGPLSFLGIGVAAIVIKKRGST